MKKLFILILITGFVTSCYDPYRPDYDYSTVAFTTANGDANSSGVLSRTVVKGEGLRLDFGVYLAGVIDNNEEQWAEYEIDPTLLNGTPYEMMPDDYYTLSNDNRFVIPAGDHIGPVTIELDSTQFVNDPNAVKEHYAIPFHLTGTSADSILATQNTKILVIKYMNEYSGFYNQTGTFTTYDANGDQINQGNIDNVLEATTVMMDTISVFGMMNQRGADYHMKFNISPDNKVPSFTYIPNPEPPLPYGNAAMDSVAPDLELSTSDVSPWETLEAVNDGEDIPPYDPSNNTGGSFTTPRYGNWPNYGLAWLQYDFGSSAYKIDSSRVYWGTDGGGLQPPTESYFEYEDPEDGTMVRYQGDMGLELHQWNKLVFDPPIITPRLRLYMRGTGSEATAVVEWEAYGRSYPNTPEQAPIASVQTEDETNTYDPSTSTLNLKYRVDFQNGNYSIVEAKLVWRNRIRDGVNEWRR